MSIIHQPRLRVRVGDLAGYGGGRSNLRALFWPHEARAQLPFKADISVKLFWCDDFRRELHQVACELSGPAAKDELRPRDDVRATALVMVPEDDPQAKILADVGR